MTTNYHTHTFRCKHAEGTASDYALAAREHGLKVLGISDHTPLPDGRWPEIRMEMSELSAYVGEIEQAREDVPDLMILKAMECEYEYEYHRFYRDELLGRLGFDYLIGGSHWFTKRGRQHSVYQGVLNASDLHDYADQIIASMESGLFAFIAHPDLFANSCDRWNQETEKCSRAILEAAQSLGVPLEINGCGLRKRKVSTSEGVRAPYPWRPFWETAASYDITVVINSDAHRPEDIISRMDEGMAIANDYGLKIADLSHLHIQAELQNVR